jgi:5'-nucleotidase
MNLLLTNDDGIDAPGLQALLEAANLLGRAAVVAPLAAHSGCSHRVTTDQALGFERREQGRIAVAGTPADCVRLGLARLVPDVHWVLAGINCGGNLGADVHHSGTVAAVREATLHGIPGIALSQYHKREHAIDWRRAARLVGPILCELLQARLPPGVFWNINLPHLDPDQPDPEVVDCPLDPSPLPLSYREENGRLAYNGNYHQRSRVAGSDVDVCFAGKIAVTRMTLY